MAATNQETHARTDQPRAYQDKSYLHGFLGTVSDFQKTGVLQDVVLQVEGRWFPCHRLVLSAASPYFMAMFTRGMVESRQTKVVLQGLDADMFGEILSYIYSGTLHVSMDTVQLLYQAADLLQLDYVRDTCSNYMAMNVERSTCVDLYMFADVFSVNVVRKACLQEIVRHFSELASSKEFCSLSVNQLTEIISNDELDVKEETIVWEAVVRWVQHSREDRLHHLPSILPHIRFNLLTSDDTAAILDHPLVREDAGSFKVIRKVVNDISYLRKRFGMDTMEMALLLSFRKKEILFMNPREGKYIRCSYGPKDHGYISAMTATSDDNIYMLASDLEDSSKLCMFRYEHLKNVWARVCSLSAFMKPGNHWLGYKEHLVEVDQCLYYIGLVQRRSDSFIWMRKYNQQKDQWQVCNGLYLDADLDAFHGAVVPCGPHLYFITKLRLYRYDPSRDLWVQRTPTTKCGLSPSTAVAMGTEIFCTDALFTKTMVYDTWADNWQQLQGWSAPESPPPRASRFFVLENKLHILLETHGTGNVTATDGAALRYLVYVYDRSANAWRDLKATIPGNDYVVCGSMCLVAPHMYRPHLDEL
ncbi:kelch repeat and BTB domain-containing protein 8-like [Branchiostoma floridae]|uniref:Kelch repeat and BTB domain-containing protein 8-like n=1 Tax=Branchiostoma floridae TaxID=7739 RepID=A0A9J7HGD2_BRAFL|nr:kelch repeat and BTB domain-containing protein 8-like [Branchiostoma floridae]